MGADTTQLERKIGRFTEQRRKVRSQLYPHMSCSALNKWAYTPLYLPPAEHKRVPAMPEPTALAWFRLTELTGKGPLGAHEYEEAHRLATVLGADIRMVQWAGDKNINRSTPAIHDVTQYPLAPLAEFSELMTARHGQSWAYRLPSTLIETRYAEYIEKRARL